MLAVALYITRNVLPFVYIFLCLKLSHGYLPILYLKEELTKKINSIFFWTYANEISEYIIL